MRTPIEKNLYSTPRTLSEANRDAQYCCAIQTFKSDAKLTWNFLVDAFIGFSIIGAGGLACYAIVKLL
jgi:hypothetical protein